MNKLKYILKVIEKIYNALKPENTYKKFYEELNDKINKRIKELDNEIADLVKEAKGIGNHDLDRLRAVTSLLHEATRGRKELSEILRK